MMCNGHRLRWLAGLMVLLLVAQFLLGMMANLFVEFPAQKDGFEVVHDSPLLAAHVVLGLCLALLALTALILSIFTKRLFLIVTFAAGFLFVVFSILNGVVFVESRGKADINSLGMAVGFILAFLSYGVMR